MECLEQLKSTIDIQNYEIIIVDDGSRVPLRQISGIKIVRNVNNKGVGQAFDAGVQRAIGENIILMACDIRFANNKWASKILKEIEDYPTAITCTTCVGLNRYSSCCGSLRTKDGNCSNSKCKNFGKPVPDNMNFERRRKIQRSFGATIMLFLDMKSLPKAAPSYRNILEAKWQAPDLKSMDRSYEIPCILGAFYGLKKDWYKHIDGFWGHKHWGTLEPYISLKSWFFGGSCRLAPHIETGHIFKKTATHNTPEESRKYNKILVSLLLLAESSRYISFLGANALVQRATAMIQKDIAAIKVKKTEYARKITINRDDFFKRWNIDMRKAYESKAANM
jgi:glycosyltransferase involved in cell wall biosynthesis